MTPDELDIVEAKAVLGRRHALERALEFHRAAAHGNVRSLLKDASAIASWLESGNIPERQTADLKAA